MKELWIVHFQSTNFEDAQECCIVEAEDSYKAIEIATPYAEQVMEKLDAFDYKMANGEDLPAPYAEIIFVEELDDQHELWERYESGKLNYPKIN